MRMHMHMQERSPVDHSGKLVPSSKICIRPCFACTLCTCIWASAVHVVGEYSVHIVGECSDHVLGEYSVHIVGECSDHG